MLKHLWTRHSVYLFSAFLITIGLIIYVWWPLARDYLAYVDWRGAWWRYMDWLLLGLFGFMSLTVMAKADLRVDWLIVFVATFGGLVIESWGTQTNLWVYYTDERPPLWIIPAWPIASLSIDRTTRLLNHILPKDLDWLLRPLYWMLFPAFYIIMLWFVAPTFDKSYTFGALIICALMILTPTNYRYALFTFIAGAALGYYLELWGTTRECWIYYTRETPPLFAVLAHGMASVVFWRSGLLVKGVVQRIAFSSPKNHVPDKSIS
jgi:hypothetical protein